MDELRANGAGACRWCFSLNACDLQPQSKKGIGTKCFGSEPKMWKVLQGIYLNLLLHAVNPYLNYAGINYLEMTQPAHGLVFFQNTGPFHKASCTKDNRQANLSF